MKTISIILVSATVIAVACVIFVYTRNTSVRSDVRDLGKDIQRGTRDASNDAKDAAEDAKDKIKDAVK